MIFQNLIQILLLGHSTPSESFSASSLEVPSSSLNHNLDPSLSSVSESVSPNTLGQGQDLTHQFNIDLTSTCEQAQYLVL